MSKKPPLVNKYQRELSKYDENQRQLAGLEKLSATFLRKISSTLRILENLDHDDLIQSILNNSIQDNNNKYPPMLSEEAVRVVPVLQKYNDRIMEICDRYSNNEIFTDIEDITDDEANVNNENNENNGDDDDDDDDNNREITLSIKESYNFIKEIPLLHKDLEGQS